MSRYLRNIVKTKAIFKNIAIDPNLEVGSGRFLIRDHVLDLVEPQLRVC